MEKNEKEPFWFCLLLNSIANPTQFYSNLTGLAVILCRQIPFGPTIHKLCPLRKKDARVLGSFKSGLKPYNI